MKDRPDYLAIHSWALYDFANTIFSMNVVSLYFALWVTVDKGGEDILYSFALSGSMLAVAVSVPVFGALSDQTRRRVGPLTVLTLVAVFCTGAIGFADNVFAGLVLFAFANYGYQSSLVFYNAMLPHISRGASLGIVSGYGVALGYLGSIAGLLMVKPFVNQAGRPAAFLPTAAMFLVFSIPCFVFVKDPSPDYSRKIQVGQAFRTLKQTVLDAGKYRNLFHFILIHFLVLDVVNTVIAFMSVYANKVIGFNDSEISTFLIVCTAAAMVGSYLIGWLVKKKGTLWSYWLVLWLWAAALACAAASPGETMFWAVGPLAGMGMGGVWVVSRPILVELAPPEKIGEFFGAYGLAGKMASIIGPLLLGTIVLVLEKEPTLKYRAAVFALLVLAMVAIFLFHALDRRLTLERCAQRAAGSSGLDSDGE
ncbi:MAG: MFS transporter [Nitrospinae bacterium]|nr:MFS transporter [Nitrospinota bacterium]